MTTMPMAHGTFQHGTTLSTDVCIVCLWSVCGLAFTGLFFALGFGQEIGQALMAAG
jgi:hypothetical protein